MRTHTTSITRGLAVAAGVALAVLSTGTARADAPVTSARQGDQAAPLMNSGPATASQSSFIVFLKDDAPRRAMASTMNAVTRHGGSVTHEYAQTLNGFAADIPVAALSEVSRSPNVDFIAADPTISVTASGLAAVAQAGVDDLRPYPVTSARAMASAGLGTVSASSTSTTSSLPRVAASLQE